MSASRGEKAVDAFGLKYVFHSVPYTSAATTFQVDQGVTAVATVEPASGPAASIGATSGGLTTINLAAGGANIGGRVVVVASHGKRISSSKPPAV